MSALDTIGNDILTKTIDPVCGMSVDPEKTKLTSVYEGNSYFFCADGCRKAFNPHPGKYINPKTAKKKGWFSRYLERMAKVNEKEFGCDGPKCH